MHVNTCVAQADRITISSDQELQEAFVLVQQRSIPLLELMITPREAQPIFVHMGPEGTSECTETSSSCDCISTPHSCSEFEVVASTTRPEEEAAMPATRSTLCVSLDALQDSETPSSSGGLGGPQTRFLFKALQAANAPRTIVDRLVDAIRYISIPL
jgi:hypothetical protein